MYGNCGVVRPSVQYRQPLCNSYVLVQYRRLWSKIGVFSMFHIDDPELTHEGQPSVPETLLLLRQKVECLSKPIQALRDLADILE